MSLGQWGLIPHWFEGSYPELKFSTLNARGETMFEKAAFSQAAEQCRAILLIDGFYEHQHRNSRIYPHFIYRQDKNPLAVACICQRQSPGDSHNTAYAMAHKTNKTSVALTFSIVTIKANALMSTIHNNPKLKEPRMPLILDHDMQAQWLEPITERSKAFEYDPSDASNTLTLSEHFMSQSRGIELKAHTVAPLRKKRSTGLKHPNSKLEGKTLCDHGETDAAAPYHYPELDQDWDLFSGLN
jgi:putative SOS response-associated peptidase YedK